MVKGALGMVLQEQLARFEDRVEEKSCAWRRQDENEVACGVRVPPTRTHPWLRLTEMCARHLLPLLQPGRSTSESGGRKRRRWWSSIVQARFYCFCFYWS